MSKQNDRSMLGHVVDCAVSNGSIAEIMVDSDPPVLTIQIDIPNLLLSNLKSAIMPTGDDEKAAGEPTIIIVRDDERMEIVEPGAQVQLANRIIFEQMVERHNSLIAQRDSWRSIAIDAVESNQCNHFVISESEITGCSWCDVQNRKERMMREHASGTFE